MGEAAQTRRGLSGARSVAKGAHGSKPLRATPGEQTSRPDSPHYPKFRSPQVIHCRRQGPGLRYRWRRVGFNPSQREYVPGTISSPRQGLLRQRPCSGGGDFQCVPAACPSAPAQGGSIMATDQSYPVDDPERWRRRAARVRQLADQASDPIAKQSLLRTAEAYEQWALRPEARPTTIPDEDGSQR